jgi:hypothetical protein
VNRHEIRIQGRALALTDGTRLNAAVSDAALAAVEQDAGRLLALLSTPPFGVEHLALGVCVLSSDAGARFIAARAQVAGEDALVFMLPEEFFPARPASELQLVVAVESGGRGPAVVDRNQLAA